MNGDRCWCVVRRAGEGYELRFGGGDGEAFFGRLRALKDRVDWHDRRFDPDAKVWHLSRAAGPALRGWVFAHFDAGQRRFVDLDPDDLADDTPPPPPPPWPAGRGPASPYDVLWVRPGAPPEVVKAAYKALAFKHHPDKGGDTAVMQAINVAFEQLQKGAA